MRRGWEGSFQRLFQCAAPNLALDPTAASVRSVPRSRFWRRLSSGIRHSVEVINKRKSVWLK